jgi:cell division protein FtsQ
VAKRLDDDLDIPEPSPYLRRARRVEVRRDAARWRRALLIGTPVVLLSGGVFAVAAYAVNTYLTTSPRFTLSEGLQVSGTQRISRDRVAQMFGGDAGRSVFEIPLERRRRELMAIPWVESAYVVRSWPNRLRVLVTERKPVAFVRLTSGIYLIDAEGVLLPLLGPGKYQFPVLNGVSESQPAAERKKRAGIMLKVLEDLDRETPRRSGDISEIDLTDPNDAALTVTESGLAVVVHLGNGHYLDRYKLFLENVEAWREQYGSVRSVDLRYEKQVIVKP